MPTFANPAFLLLLVLVPPTLWLWMRRPPAALRFSATQIVASLPPGRSRRARLWGIVLRGAGLLFLVVALAGPRWPDNSSRLPTEGIAIAMVVDVSASMNERDFFWDEKLLSRLDAVKRIFRMFVFGGAGPGGVRIEPRHNDLIGLVTFAAHPDTVCPLTLDYASLLQLLDSEEARTVAGEATTNPGDAIAWTVAMLQKAPTRHKIVIFLTDGESNVPPPALTPRQAAQLAGNLGIPVYAIEAGSESENPPDKDAAAKAQNSLEEIARISGGNHFQARDGRALAEAIAAIDKLERDRIESFQYRRYHEGFAVFAALALVSWLTLHTLEATRWRRLP
ncbi:MAG: VWA domain-containing protein [Planctomycetes bacterium]|nr:VWA domain-containing protein [Planctomycetota bacterium]